jgi:alpha-mannosidase
LTGYNFTPRTLVEPWRDLMLNQFHDILPGSSIQRVYQEAEAAYAAVLEKANQQVEQAMEQFVDTAPGSGSGSGATSGVGALTVFNSLSWARQALVQMGGKAVQVTVPSCGWTTVQAEWLRPVQQGSK